MPRFLLIALLWWLSLWFPVRATSVTSPPIALSVTVTTIFNCSFLSTPSRIVVVPTTQGNEKVVIADCGMATINTSIRIDQAPYNSSTLTISIRNSSFAVIVLGSNTSNVTIVMEGTDKDDNHSTFLTNGITNGYNTVHENLQITLRHWYPPPQLVGAGWIAIVFWNAVIVSPVILAVDDVKLPATDSKAILVSWCTLTTTGSRSSGSAVLNITATNVGLMLPAATIFGADYVVQLGNIITSGSASLQGGQLTCWLKIAFSDCNSIMAKKSLLYISNSTLTNGTVEFSFVRSGCYVSCHIFEDFGNEMHNSVVTVKQCVSVYTSTVKPVLTNILFGSSNYTNLSLDVTDSYLIAQEDLLTFAMGTSNIAFLQCNLAGVVNVTLDNVYASLFAPTRVYSGAVIGFANSSLRDTLNTSASNFAQESRLFLTFLRSTMIVQTIAFTNCIAFNVEDVLSDGALFASAVVMRVDELTCTSRNGIGLSSGGIVVGSVAGEYLARTPIALGKLSIDVRNSVITATSMSNLSDSAASGINVYSAVIEESMSMTVVNSTLSLNSTNRSVGIVLSNIVGGSPASDASLTIDLANTTVNAVSSGGGATGVLISGCRLYRTVLHNVTSNLSVVPLQPEGIGITVENGTIITATSFGGDALGVIITNSSTMLLHVFPSSIAASDVVAYMRSASVAKGTVDRSGVCVTVQGGSKIGSMGFRGFSSHGLAIVPLVVATATGAVPALSPHPLTAVFELWLASQNATVLSTVPLWESSPPTVMIEGVGTEITSLVANASADDILIAKSTAFESCLRGSCGGTTCSSIAIAIDSAAYANSSSATPNVHSLRLTIGNRALVAQGILIANFGGDGSYTEGVTITIDSAGPMTSGLVLKQLTAWSNVSSPSAPVAGLQDGTTIEVRNVTFASVEGRYASRVVLVAQNVQSDAMLLRRNILVDLMTSLNGVVAGIAVVPPGNSSEIVALLGTAIYRSLTVDVHEINITLWDQTAVTVRHAIWNGVNSVAVAHAIDARCLGVTDARCGLLSVENSTAVGYLNTIFDESAQMNATKPIVGTNATTTLQLKLINVSTQRNHEYRFGMLISANISSSLTATNETHFPKLLIDVSNLVAEIEGGFIVVSDDYYDGGIQRQTEDPMRMLLGFAIVIENTDVRTNGTGVFVTSSRIVPLRAVPRGGEVSTVTVTNSSLTSFGLVGYHVGNIVVFSLRRHHGVVGIAGIDVVVKGSILRVYDAKMNVNIGLNIAEGVSHASVLVHGNSTIIGEQHLIVSSSALMSVTGISNCTVVLADSNLVINGSRALLRGWVARRTVILSAPVIQSVDIQASNVSVTMLTDSSPAHNFVNSVAVFDVGGGNTMLDPDIMSLTPLAAPNTPSSFAQLVNDTIAILVDDVTITVAMCTMDVDTFPSSRLSSIIRLSATNVMKNVRVAVRSSSLIMRAAVGLNVFVDPLWTATVAWILPVGTSDTHVSGYAENVSITVTDNSTLGCRGDDSSCANILMLSNCTLSNKSYTLTAGAPMTTLVGVTVTVSGGSNLTALSLLHSFDVPLKAQGFNFAITTPLLAPLRTPATPMNAPRTPQDCVLVTCYACAYVLDDANTVWLESNNPQSAAFLVNRTNFVDSYLLITGRVAIARTYDVNAMVQALGTVLAAGEAPLVTWSGFSLRVVDGPRLMYGGFSFVNLAMLNCSILITGPTTVVAYALRFEWCYLREFSQLMTQRLSGGLLNTSFGPPSSAAVISMLCSEDLAGTPPPPSAPAPQYANSSGVPEIHLINSSIWKMTFAYCHCITQMSFDHRRAALLVSSTVFSGMFRFHNVTIFRTWSDNTSRFNVILMDLYLSTMYNANMVITNTTIGGAFDVHRTSNEDTTVWMQYNTLSVNTSITVDGLFLRGPRDSFVYLLFAGGSTSINDSVQVTNSILCITVAVDIVSSNVSSLRVSLTGVKTALLGGDKGLILLMTEIWNTTWRSFVTGSSLEWDNRNGFPASVAWMADLSHYFTHDEAALMPRFTSDVNSTYLHRVVNIGNGSVIYVDTSVQYWAGLEVRIRGASLTTASNLWHATGFPPPVVASLTFVLIDCNITVRDGGGFDFFSFSSATDFNNTLTLVDSSMVVLRSIVRYSNSEAGCTFGVLTSCAVRNFSVAIVDSQLIGNVTNDLQYAAMVVVFGSVVDSFGVTISGPATICRLFAVCSQTLRPVVVDFSAHVMFADNIQMNNLSVVITDGPLLESTDILAQAVSSVFVGGTDCTSCAISIVNASFVVSYSAAALNLVEVVRLMMDFPMIGSVLLLRGLNSSADAPLKLRSTFVAANITMTGVKAIIDMGVDSPSSNASLWVSIAVSFVQSSITVARMRNVTVTAYGASIFYLTRSNMTDKCTFIVEGGGEQLVANGSTAAELGGRFMASMMVGDLIRWSEAALEFVGWPTYTFPTALSSITSFISGGSLVAIRDLRFSGTGPQMIAFIGVSVSQGSAVVFENCTMKRSEDIVTSGRPDKGDCLQWGVSMSKCSIFFFMNVDVSFRSLLSLSGIRMINTTNMKYFVLGGLAIQVVSNSSMRLDGITLTTVLSPPSNQWRDIVAVMYLTSIIVTKESSLTVANVVGSSRPLRLDSRCRMANSTVDAHSAVTLSNLRLVMMTLPSPTTVVIMWFSGLNISSHSRLELHSLELWCDGDSVTGSKAILMNDVTMSQSASVFLKNSNITSRSSSANVVACFYLQESFLKESSLTVSDTNMSAYNSRMSNGFGVLQVTTCVGISQTQWNTSSIAIDGGGRALADSSSLLTSSLLFVSECTVVTAGMPMAIANNSFVIQGFRQVNIQSFIGNVCTMCISGMMAFEDSVVTMKNMNSTLDGLSGAADLIGTFAQKWLRVVIILCNITTSFGSGANFGSMTSVALTDIASVQQAHISLFNVHSLVSPSLLLSNPLLWGCAAAVGLSSVKVTDIVVNVTSSDTFSLRDSPAIFTAAVRPTTAVVLLMSCAVEAVGINVDDSNATGFAVFLNGTSLQRGNVTVGSLSSLSDGLVSMWSYSSLSSTIVTAASVAFGRADGAAVACYPCRGVPVATSIIDVRFGSLMSLVTLIMSDEVTVQCRRSSSGRSNQSTIRAAIAHCGTDSLFIATSTIEMSFALNGVPLLRGDPSLGSVHSVVRNSVLRWTTADVFWLDRLASPWIANITLAGQSAVEMDHLVFDSALGQRPGGGGGGASVIGGDVVFEAGSAFRIVQCSLSVASFTTFSMWWAMETAVPPRVELYCSFSASGAFLNRLKGVPRVLTQVSRQTSPVNKSLCTGYVPVSESASPTPSHGSASLTEATKALDGKAAVATSSLSQSVQTGTMDVSRTISDTLLITRSRTACKVLQVEAVNPLTGRVYDVYSGRQADYTVTGIMSTDLFESIAGNITSLSVTCSWGVATVRRADNGNSSTPSASGSSIVLPFRILMRMTVAPEASVNFAADVSATCNVSYAGGGLCRPSGFTMLLLHTVLPTPLEIRRPTQVAVTAVGPLVSIASGSMAMSMQRSVFMLSLSVCEFSMQEPLTIADSPTQLGFGAADGMYIRGGAVGNMLLLLAFVVGTLLWAAVQQRKLPRKSGNDSSIRTLLRSSWALFTRMPGALFIPGSLLLQPTVSSCVSSFLYPATSYDVAIGVLLLIPLLSPFVLFAFYCGVPPFHRGNFLRNVAPTAANDDSRRSSSLVERLFDESNLWMPRTASSDSSAQRAAKEVYFKAFQLVFDENRRERHWFFAVDVAGCCVFGVLGGMKPMTTDGCRALQIACVTLSIVLLGVTLWLRPRNTMFGQLVLVCNTASTAASAIFVAAGDSLTSDVIAIAQVFANVVLSLVLLGDWIRRLGALSVVQALVRLITPSLYYDHYVSDDEKNNGVSLAALLHDCRAVHRQTEQTKGCVAQPLFDGEALLKAEDGESDRIFVTRNVSEQLQEFSSHGPQENAIVYDCSPLCEATDAGISDHALGKRPSYSSRNRAMVATGNKSDQRTRGWTVGGSPHGRPQSVHDSRRRLQMLIEAIVSAKRVGHHGPVAAQ